jgi:site-specific recombinase XerD
VITTSTLKLPETSVPTERQNNPYIEAATAPNTRIAYRQDVAHFTTWGVLPTTPQAIVRYLEAFATQLNPRTLIRRLTALKHWHLYQGFTDPTASSEVRKTLKGIFYVHGKPKNKASALSLEHLKQLIHWLNQQDPALAMLRNKALLQVGFFGAFRSSELAQLQCENLRFVPEGVDILITRSKTDPLGKGQSCSLPYGNEMLCPVKALKDWCEQAAISQGPVFRAINQYGHLSTHALSNQSISFILKKIAQDAQLDPTLSLSSHSLRRGFATTASRKGASFMSIMQQGRWRNQNTVMGYIEEGHRFSSNAAHMILRTENPEKEDKKHHDPIE